MAPGPRAVRYICGRLVEPRRRSRREVARAVPAEEPGHAGARTSARPVEAGSRSAAVTSPVGAGATAGAASSGRVAVGCRPFLPTSPDRNRPDTVGEITTRRQTEPTLCIVVEFVR